MRLGNSNGNNKGKRYFVRGRDDQNMDVVYAEKADDFARWFAQNHEATKRQLIGKEGYDDDTFNETYLRIYEIILFTGRHIKDYASYFHRAYYTNFIQGLSQQTRYCELFPNYDIEDEPHGSLMEEIEEKNRNLSNDVMEYVYRNYDLRDFEIFKMYVNLKPAVNYHALSRMTNLKYHVIQRMISNIILDIKTNPFFSVRRRELVGA